MKVLKLSDLGGVQVEGVDLASARSAEEDRHLRQLFDEHGLVVFRDQKLTKQQLLAAGEPFGGIVTKRAAVAVASDAPGISVLSSRGPDGNVLPERPDELIGDTDWHTDDGYLTTPNRGKILYGVQVPEEGGMTGFIDGITTYGALSETMRAKIENLHVIQSWNKSQSNMGSNRRYRLKGDEVLTYNKFQDVAYSLVHAHPITGKKVLNCPPLWATGIVEMPGAEGEALVEELIAHITQEKFQYWHKYRVGDAVLWDNWRFAHAGSGTLGRYVRTVWGITLKSGPTLGRELNSRAA